ncbi:MAG: hypothetical protein JSS35_06750 [Proteobacteria bacterium]|nr:hypothetical protein [Pseudomonadota bacterium]
MKPLTKTALAGAAVLALGMGTLAVAAARNSHVLTVQLPDGAVERIHYTGDVAPTVRFEPDAVQRVLFAPIAFAPIGLEPDPVFARLEAISAAMDRQAAEMMADLEAPDFGQADLPSGAQGYTMVSTMSGSGVCTQTYQYVARPGEAPKVTRHSSGCGGAQAPASTQAAPETSAPPTPLAPGLIQASYRPAH